VIPEAVRAAWGWGEAEVRALSGGLINATYAVAQGGAPVAVVQRLHPIFAGEVNLDLERVTAHLAAHGLVTPRLIRTGGGAAWITVDDQVWRALTWVEGVAFGAVPSLEHARAGGALVGRFHRAVADLHHDYAFARAGVHDTAAHLAKLRARLTDTDTVTVTVTDTVTVTGTDTDTVTVTDTDTVTDTVTDTDTATVTDTDTDTATDTVTVIGAAVEVGHAILAAAGNLPTLTGLPLHHSHGDLKISNLLFNTVAPPRGVALVDLDTLGRQPLAFELGDAMRSWCNPRGEDTGAIELDLGIFAAAIGGWTEVAGGLASAAERRSIVDGLETVCVELAARFALDVFEDRYFGWDPARFPSRRAHNLVRARGQLALAAAVHAARADALSIVAR